MAAGHDLAHFVVAAVDRVSLSAFAVPGQRGGKPQYPPWLILPLLIHTYANGIFSSRTVERAIGVPAVEQACD